jgi:quinol monooxygenase YgiN
MDTTKTTSTTAAAIVTHKVKDYSAWRAGFDAHASARKQAGIIGHHINRMADDPSTVSVYLAANTQDALRAFAASPSLREAAKGAGVVGEPVIVLLSPQDDCTVRKPAAAAVVVHDVADYAAWKQVLDQDDATRKQAGIIGYAVNRRADNPNTVVIYLQADSLDQIKSFASSPDLKATMQRAGVIGAPQITFVQGQDWASYE